MSLVRFGATGFKIRLFAVAGASLFTAWVLATETIARLLPSVMLFGWLLILAVIAALFLLVSRTTDEGQLEPAFINALVPWYLWPPAIIWVVLMGDNDIDPFGRWHVFGSYWGGGTLYFVMLASLIVYGLLRMNLQRFFGRPR